jgi:hypothetical protein
VAGTHAPQRMVPPRRSKKPRRSFALLGLPPQIIEVRAYHYSSPDGAAALPFNQKDGALVAAPCRHAKEMLWFLSGIERMRLPVARPLKFVPTALVTQRCAWAEALRDVSFGRCVGAR